MNAVISRLWARTRWLHRVLILILVLGLTGAVQAHRPSDGWLQLTVTNQSVTLQLDLALKDLDAVLGLDTSDDGKLTWGELRRREPDLLEYLTRRLTLTNATERLRLVPEPLRLINHEEVMCASLFFTAEAGAPLTNLTLTYRCLFELDPQHRALIQALWAGALVSGDGPAVSAAGFTALLSPGSPSVTFVNPSVTAGSPAAGATAIQGAGQAFGQFFREGIHHIWTGYDHLLFLAALLLPAVRRRAALAGCADTTLAEAVKGVLLVVTAFTVAHSLTLAVAVFGIARPPSRLIESLIAGSVLVAAVRNLRPVRSPASDGNAAPSRRWIGWEIGIPFGFGLIHGFGFANALGELGLSGAGLIFPLIAFNLGVETGQLAAVAVFLPPVFALRRTVWYRRGLLPVGSALIAVIAAAWLLDRVFALGFMNF